MVSLVEKMGSATYLAALNGAFGLAIGYAGGYIYAKLADLPAGEVAKAYAVGQAAINSIIFLVEDLTWGMKYARHINGAVSVLIFSAYAYELRRRGYMGDKLLIIGYIFLAIHIWGTVLDKRNQLP